MIIQRGLFHIQEWKGEIFILPLPLLFFLEITPAASSHFTDDRIISVYVLSFNDIIKNAFFYVCWSLYLFVNAIKVNLLSEIILSFQLKIYTIYQNNKTSNISYIITNHNCLSPPLPPYLPNEFSLFTLQFYFCVKLLLN